MAQIDINNCFTYAYSSGVIGDFYQNISGVAEVSTNAINLDAAGIKIAGGSKPPWLIVRVGAAADACVSIEIKLVTATAADLTTGQKVVKYFRFLQGALTAGALVVNEPLGHFDYQQYLGMEFTPFTSDNSLTVVAYLSDGPEPAVTDVTIEEAGT